MKKNVYIWLVSTLLFLLIFAVSGLTESKKGDKVDKDKSEIKIKIDADGKIRLTDQEWKMILPPNVYRIVRKGETEYPFTGKYNGHKAKGIYVCAACGNELFSSDAKYESGSGWPSFFKPADTGLVAEIVDNTFGMRRIEVNCNRCGAHLGHVFPDGPKPTGLRYCVNSGSLNFKPDSTKVDKEQKDTHN